MIQITTTEKEVRTRLPNMLPIQFIFAAATMVNIGPFSAGNMIIERFSKKSCFIAQTAMIISKRLSNGKVMLRNV